MAEHTERFTGRVKEYARYRTRYPPELLTWLRNECGLTADWIVADVGAGTGMLAEMFLENGNPVTAVEPNAEMRAECERLCARFPKLAVRDGTAERTGLDARSTDLVSVGRAFHWFEPVGAAAEFRRLLRPGGWVLIASSGRRKEETEQSKEMEALLMEHGTDYAHVRDRYRRRDRIDAFLRSLGGQPLRVEFTEEVPMRWEEFVGSVQSMSIAPLEGAAGHAGMQEALKAFFARWSVDGVLSVPMSCSVDAVRVGEAGGA